jgi:hypothetical protein
MNTPTADSEARDIRDAKPDSMWFGRKVRREHLRLLSYHRVLRASAVSALDGGEALIKP